MAAQTSSPRSGEIKDASDIADTLPAFSLATIGDAQQVTVTGVWNLTHAREAELCCANVQKQLGPGHHVVLDLSGISHMDTSGAWQIDRLRQQVVDNHGAAAFSGVSPERDALIKEAHFRTFAALPAAKTNGIVDFLSDIGRAMVATGRDFFSGIDFLGRVVAALVRLFAAPHRFRLTSMVYHIDSFAFRSVPIIALINFLVGCIVAQQGIFQLRRFGAEAFAVDLVGILVLRELAVLLTSIMIAGRSGSAITAEIGSMKMREEIDALNVMGLDPIDVLILPRLLALVISLPLLTFIADMAAIFGGIVVAKLYAGMSPEIYLGRLQEAITLHTLLVGLIKAPFMALMIGLIATIEGLAVKGSAESLGRQVTASVVKSIFMVIMMDGLFALFFTAINY